MNIKQKLQEVRTKDEFFRLAPKKKKQAIAKILKDRVQRMGDEKDVYPFTVGDIYESTGVYLQGSLIEQLIEHYKGV